MSAFVHDVAHVRALVNAGLKEPRMYPMRWGTRALTADELSRAYQSGEAWGPDAVEIAQSNSRTLTPETAGMIGAMLMAENMRSVNYRYNEEEVEPAYTHGADAREYTPEEVLRALTSYEYQSCETPDWQESEAWRFCHALRLVLIDRLPGFQAAQTWSIYDAEMAR